MKQFMTAVLMTLMFMPLSAVGVRAMESKTFTDSSTFAQWYAKAVNALSHNSIITGYADGSFRPQQPVTRGEVALMFQRFATAIGVELKEEPRICTMEYRYGLALFVYNQFGTPVEGARISFEQIGGDEKDVFSEGEPGTYSGIGEGNGHYRVLIEKDGYAPFTRTYTLDHDGCHVISSIDTITLIQIQ